MKKQVEVLDKSTPYKKFVFRIDEAHLRFQLYSGKMSDVVTRVSFERGDSAAALVHNRTQDTLILVEQFRYSAYTQGQGWLVELPAGIIKPDEDVESSLKRELREEIGYVVPQLEKIGEFFLSPGASSERIELFYAPVDDAHHVEVGGGLVDEGEDIRVLTVAVDKALTMLAQGEVQDIKTAYALQWLAMRR